MIVQHGDRPDYYSACLACGWCSKPQASALAALDADDKHLAAKLAALADRRGATTSLTPAAEAGSVGTPSDGPTA